MEQQKLPNVTTAIVLAIISYVCCCFSAGLGGIIMSGIALFLTSKDEKLYKQSPEDYSNFSQLKTAKTLAIIGLVLGVLTLIWVIYSIIHIGGWEAYQEQMRGVMDQYGIEE